MRPSEQTILVEMSFICIRMENHFHIKGWALNLVLIQRPRGTRWWPIDSGATSQINRISSTQRSYLKLIELKISGTCISMIFLTEIIDEGHLYAEFIISFQLCDSCFATAGINWHQNEQGDAYFNVHYPRGHLHSTRNHYHRWKRVYYLRLLDPEIPPNTYLFPSGQPRSRWFSCGDYRTYCHRNGEISRYWRGLRRQCIKTEPIKSLRGICYAFFEFVRLFSRPCLLGTCFRRLAANSSSHHKQSGLHL